MMIEPDSLDGIDVMNDPSEHLRQVSIAKDDQLISEATRQLGISSISSHLSMHNHIENDANKKLISCMFITANVGTIFEEVSF